MVTCERCGDELEEGVCFSCVARVKKLHRTERWLRKIMRREAARWRAKRDLQGGQYGY